MFGVSEPHKRGLGAPETCRKGQSDDEFVPDSKDNREYQKTMDMVKAGRKLEKNLMANRAAVAAAIVQAGGKMHIDTAAQAVVSGGTTRTSRPAGPVPQAEKEKEKRKGKDSKKKRDKKKSKKKDKRKKKDKKSKSKKKKGKKKKKSSSSSSSSSSGSSSASSDSSSSPKEAAEDKAGEGEGEELDARALAEAEVRAKDYLKQQLPLLEKAWSNAELFQEEANRNPSDREAKAAAEAAKRRAQELQQKLQQEAMAKAREEAVKAAKRKRFDPAEGRVA